jgi:Uncharacterized protein conserved in bacteria (DUF2188)
MRRSQPYSTAKLKGRHRKAHRTVSIASHEIFLGRFAGFGAWFPAAKLAVVGLRERNLAGGTHMSEVTYEIVEHDGGWAYKANGVFSESFPTHAEALAAAQMAAAEQRVPGTSETIEYEDEKGRWHTENVRGGDRPMTEVKDKS